MAAPPEASLIYAFAALLAIGAAILLVVPFLRHAIAFSANRRVLIGVVALCLGLASAAVLAVAFSTTDPATFVPVVGVVVALRVVSPTVLYLRIRDRLDVERGWRLIRLGVAVVYVIFVGDLVYSLLRIAVGEAPADAGVVTEQLAMAAGASAVVVRAAVRIRPRPGQAFWPAWIAATLLAIAFVIVAPYAFPGFALAYILSGLVGWTVGAVVVRYVA